jgi:aryl-alcohol dehydrogenase-like predicted oxidoreductase
MSLPHLPIYPLGKTGLTVPRLSFGTVYLHPGKEGNMPPEAGADLLIEALQRGINFWDTSDDYGTHPHVACALRRIPRNQVILSTKISSPQSTVDTVLKELGTDYLDILYVHCVFPKDIEYAHEMIRSWQPEKARGRLYATGLTTHSIEVARIATEWPENDVMMVPVNQFSLVFKNDPVSDGTLDDLLKVIQKATEAGKGIIAMKVMAGGALTQDPASNIRYVAGLPWVHSLVIGMKNVAEVEENLRLVCSSSSIQEKSR